MLNYVYGENGMSAALCSTFSLTLIRIRLAALTPWQSTGIKAATPIGNLFGQIIFGWLADVLGRKRMCK